MNAVAPEEAPELLAARAYMRHKGYGSEPLGVDVVEGEHVWYFYFEVPEGLIELEVEYGPVDDGFPTPTWRCQVAEFWLYDEMGEGWSPAAYVEQLLGAAEGTDG